MGKRRVVRWVVAEDADPFTLLVTDCGWEPGAIPVIPTDKAVGYWGHPARAQRRNAGKAIRS